MECWKCGTVIEEIKGKISFRAQCDKCQSWLHVCKNCKNYRVGLPNDCMIPGTDFVADREKMNFCEEFQPLGKGPNKKIDAKDVFNRLFGED